MSAASDPWSMLGVPRDASVADIRRAYASRLRVTRPEDDPEGFGALRAAYEHLLAVARAGLAPIAAEVADGVPDPGRQPVGNDDDTDPIRAERDLADDVVDDDLEDDPVVDGFDPRPVAVELFDDCRAFFGNTDRLRRRLAEVLGTISLAQREALEVCLASEMPAARGLEAPALHVIAEAFGWTDVKHLQNGPWVLRSPLFVAALERVLRDSVPPAPPVPPDRAEATWALLQMVLLGAAVAGVLLLVFKYADRRSAMQVLGMTAFGVYFAGKMVYATYFSYEGRWRRAWLIPVVSIVAAVATIVLAAIVGL